MSVQFLESVFEDSRKHPNFFNGRILTATDLRDEQAANTRRARQLGQAAGEGVVYGLYVTKTSDSRTLRITNGLAISRSGDALYLPGATTDVELVQETRSVASTNSPFVTCDLAGAVNLTGTVPTDFYLLAITSASRLSRSLAPHSGLNGGPAVCTSRYEEIGVQLKLVPLTPDVLIETIDKAANRRRSRLAHVCFGTNGRIEYAADPLRQTPPNNLVDRLRDGPSPGLTECDVPLAVFQFGDNGIDFVDTWAVRRPSLPGQYLDAYPGAHVAMIDALNLFAAPQRAVDSLAFLLQFQNQLEDIRTDAALRPPEIAAATYFDYLPAAGYLPAADSPPAGVSNAASSHPRHFRLDTFFSRGNIQPSELDPAYLRSIFHESLYVEPIRVDDDVAIDLFTLRGAPEDERFVIFVRRQALTVQPSPPPEPDDTGTTEPPVVRTGDLYITVLDESGSPYPAFLIDSVTATNTKTGVKEPGILQFTKPTLGSGRIFRQYQHWMAQEQENVRLKYAAEATAPVAEVAIDVADFFEGTPVYVFSNLPAGTYNVLATPNQSRRPKYGTWTSSIWTLGEPYGVSKPVTVLAGTVVHESVVIRQSKVGWPEDPCLKVRDRRGLPWGVVLDCLPFDPGWKYQWPDWKPEPFPDDPGWIDPPEELWLPLDDPYVRIQAEEILSKVQDSLGPGVVTNDPTIYVRQGYNPAMPSDTVDAFLQTQDGTRFPLVVVPVDNALEKSVPVTRTEIPDYDAAIYAQLHAVGLGSLEAAASAPPGLIAAVLGQDTEYASSLIADTRSSLIEDFQNGFMGYPGVTRAINNQLKQTFTDKVGLANATPAQITAALQAVPELATTPVDGFARRLQADARAIVPATSYDLSESGFAANHVAALANMATPVYTYGQFLDLYKTEQGRATLSEVLGVDDTVLEGYQKTAANSIATGKVLTAPTKSIATLEGMTPTLATHLTGQGIYDALALSLKDPAEVTASLPADSGITAPEITTIIDTAARLTLSEVHTVAITEATHGAVSPTAEDITNLPNAASIATGEAALTEELLPNVAAVDIAALQDAQDLYGEILGNINIAVLERGLTR